MEDFLLLEEQLNEDELLIRNNVARFVEDKVIGLMKDYYERAEFPLHLIPELAKLGLFGMTLPSAYGGSEANYVSYGLVCQELERGDSALRSFVSVQSSLCMFPIFQFGSEAQKKQFLPPMARGELIACFGLTEPNHGSDPASMETTAREVDGGWILNGSKLWITNASIADVAIVWAKTSNGIRGFIVEKSFQGFKQNHLTHKMSLRASVTGELVFSDCFVPDENLLPKSDVGLVAPLQCLTQARYGIAWGAMGAAMNCYDIALDYTKSRRQFNKPLCANQLIQKDLADMLSEIVKAQCLNLHVGRLKDANKATPVMISLAKRNSAHQALNIARKSRNLLGANGITLDYHVIRHMTNLESIYTYEGTDNIHTLFIGKHITGMSAF